MLGIRIHTHRKDKTLVALTQGSIYRDCHPRVIACQPNPELFSWRSWKLNIIMEMNLNW